MTDADAVLTVEKDDHIATVWLDNEAKRNALGLPFWRDMPSVMAELDADDDVRAIVIAGRGVCFTARIDVAFLAGMGGSLDVEGPKTFRGLNGVKRLQQAISAVADTSKPTIAAIHGWCVGAGVDLISACDIRIAAADAKFSVRETRLAIVADVGTLQRLPRVIPAGHVAELAFTGKDIDAERALRIGLVNDVYPDQEAVLKAGRELAAEIAALSPAAVQGTKKVLRYTEDHTVEDGLDGDLLRIAALRNRVGHGVDRGPLWLVVGRLGRQRRHGGDVVADVRAVVAGLDQRDADRLEGVLAGRVPRVERHTHQPGERRHVDDRAGAVLPHGRQYGAEHAEHAEHVGFEDRPHQLLGIGLHR